MWTAAPQAPLSMGFSMQEHWSGLPCLPPGDRPDPGIEPALAGRFFTTNRILKKKKKKTQMNLFTKQKQTHRHRKQTYGYQRGKEGEG